MTKESVLRNNKANIPIGKIFLELISKTLMLLFSLKVNFYFIFHLVFMELLALYICYKARESKKEEMLSISFTILKKIYFTSYV